MKVIWGPYVYSTTPPPLSTVCTRSGENNLFFYFTPHPDFSRDKARATPPAPVTRLDYSSSPLSRLICLLYHDLSTALAAYPMTAAGTQSRRHLTARRKMSLFVPPREKEYISREEGRGGGLSCLPAIISRFPIVYLVRATLSTGVRDTHAAAAAQHRVCFFFALRDKHKNKDLRGKKKYCAVIQP